MRDTTILLDKLARLREADREFRVFGSEQHRYRLGPCLTEMEIQQFEHPHQITLPEEYRDFLLHVGNGGAGPYYGLLPLEKSVESEESEFLARPFPHANWWNGMTPPNWWDVPSEQREPTQFDPRQEEEYFADKHIQGTLCLAHEGCGYYRLLVVSGPERGYIWSDERAGDGGVFPIPHPSGSYRVEGFYLVPEEPQPPRVTFWQWYLDWLDEALQKRSK